MLGIEGFSGYAMEGAVVEPPSRSRRSARDRLEHPGMTAALERAHLVRSVAEVLSSDAPIAQLWPRCCSLLAALAGSERVTIALREPTGDRIAFVFSADAPADAARRADPRRHRSPTRS